MVFQHLFGEYVSKVIKTCANQSKINYQCIGISSVEFLFEFSIYHTNFYQGDLQTL